MKFSVTQHILKSCILQMSSIHSPIHITPYMVSREYWMILDTAFDFIIQADFGRIYQEGFEKVHSYAGRHNKPLHIP